MTGLKYFSRAAPESAVALASRSGSARSAPAQKPRPAPVSNTARTEESAARSSQQSLNSATILRDTAFSRSGALKVSVARPSFLASRIFSYCIASAPGEGGGPLCEEGRDALLVIGAAAQRALAVALEVELLVERVGGSRLDRLLARGIGQCRAGTATIRDLHLLLHPTLHLNPPPT